jgi:hypothetical protein
MNLPAEIYSAESVRAIDQIAINDTGISGYALMTRAAEAALDEAQARFPAAKRWQVICGALGHPLYALYFDPLLLYYEGGGGDCLDKWQGDLFG